MAVLLSPIVSMGCGASSRFRWYHTIHKVYTVLALVGGNTICLVFYGSYYLCVICNERYTKAKELIRGLLTPSYIVGGSRVIEKSYPDRFTN